MKKYLSSYWIRSALFTILQRFSVTLFGLVNFVILIRHLTKPEMGVWAFFLVVTTLFETAKSSLLKNAHIKYVGSNAEEKTSVASSSILLNAGINIIFILFIFAFADRVGGWLGAGPAIQPMLRWYVPAMAIMVFFSHFEAVAQSHLDFKSVFAGYFTRQLVFFALLFGCSIFHISFSLVDVVIFQGVSILVATIVIYLFSRKHLLYVFNPTVRWVRALVGFGGYVFGIAITGNLFSNLDQLLIGKFTSNNSMVANYNAATRISSWVDIPSYAAAEILLPKVSQVDVQSGRYQLKYMYERMVAVLLSFTVPVALVIFFFPRPIISLIAGKQYVDAAFILQMYMLSALVRPIQNQAANIFLYIGKARLCFFLNLLFLAVNSGLNYLCFIEFGAYGAAIGNVIGCVLGTVVWYSILQKTLHVQYGHIAKHVVLTYKTIYSKIRLMKDSKKLSSLLAKQD